MEKIIHRGRLTVLSPGLEATVQAVFDYSNEDQLEAAIGFVHQFQAAIIELLRHQRLDRGDCVAAWKIGDSIFSQVGFNSALYCALSDLQSLSGKVCDMYHVEDLLEGVEAVELDGLDSIPVGTMVFLNRDVDSVPATQKAVFGAGDGGEYAGHSFVRVQRPVFPKAEHEILSFLLNYVFGFDSFRENQIDGIIRGIHREDSIVLLPTGSGKSVVFQLLSLVTPGVAFVVDPIISLIEDQLYNLYLRGIDRVAGISYDLPKEERTRIEEGIAKGSFLISFVSPERFQNQRFLDSIERFARTNLVSAIAVDEAHCVSEWGHDFRTSYLGLAKMCRTICKTGDAVPPLLALTGTASPSVLRDMQRDLEIMDVAAVIQPSSFNRPELEYRVVAAPSEKKGDCLEYLLQTYLPIEFGDTFPDFYEPQGDRTNCGVIFCPHVNGSKGLLNSRSAVAHGHGGAFDIAQRILPNLCSIYSGKQPRYLRESDDQWLSRKRKEATRFKGNGSSVMVATKAFGMGIDKPNIRWIVHYGIPSSLESYYQEAGRAARDKSRAVCCIILSNDAPEFNEMILDPSRVPIEGIIERDSDRKGRWGQDDVSVQLFFHRNAFSGIAGEVDECREVLLLCKRCWRPDKRFHIAFPSEGNKEEREYAKIRREKAIYRLQLLGIFKSYTLDHNAEEFVICSEKLNKDVVIENYLNYIRGYQEDESYLNTARQHLERRVAGLESVDFIIAVIETLLREFTYRVVEEGRRRAIYKMLDVATQASRCRSKEEADELFRKMLLDYLKVDRQVGLADLVNRATDFDLARKLAKKATSMRAAESLAGQIDRYLEAYPQHFGFHFMQLLLYLRCGKDDAFVRSFGNAAYYGRESYGLSDEAVRSALLSGIEDVKKKSKVSIEAWNGVLATAEKEWGSHAENSFSRIDVEQLQEAITVRSCYRIVSKFKELSTWRKR